MKRTSSKIVVVAYFNERGLLTHDLKNFLKLSTRSFDVHVFHIGELAIHIDEYPNVQFSFCAAGGYDLNAYLCGAVKYMYSEDVDRLIFMNNSIEILEPVLFVRTLELMFERLTVVDFVAVTKSFEETEHYQSYLFGLKKGVLSSQLFRKFIDDGFNSKPLSRFEVIQYFELNTIYSLNNDGFSHDNIYKPHRKSLLRVYLRYLVFFGFVDNSQGLLFPNRVNLSTYSKSEMSALYGFRKIKNSSLMNKLIKVYEKFTELI
jgi:hypothetical protein